jgi:chondroitin AC lyase
MYLMRAGDEYHNLQPMWDWDALPGTTWAKGSGELQRREFAGALGDGTSGLAAVDMAFGEKPDAGKPEAPAKLSMRKMWAFHGETVVCLIGDLKGNAQTSLDQSRLVGEVDILKQMIHTEPAGPGPDQATVIVHNGFEYRTLANEKVQVKEEEARGSWRRISNAGAEQEHGAKVFRAVMQNKPGSGGYSVTDVAARPINETEEILRNDGGGQGVKFGDGTIMAAFYEAGTVGDLRANRPCLLLTRGGKIWAADPLHKGGHLEVTSGGKQVTLNLPADGSAVTADAR